MIHCIWYLVQHCTKKSSSQKRPTKHQRIKILACHVEKVRLSVQRARVTILRSGAGASTLITSCICFLAVAKFIDAYYVSDLLPFNNQDFHPFYKFNFLNNLFSRLLALRATYTCTNAEEGKTGWSLVINFVVIFIMLIIFVPPFLFLLCERISLLL